MREGRTLVRTVASRLMPRRLQLALTTVLCSRPISWAIDTVFGDAIPSGPLRIFASGKDVEPATRASLFWKVYESAEIRFVNRYLRSDLDVVELGSSIGVVSSYIARKLSPGRRLVCVEANPALLPYIERNIATNAPAAEFSVVHAAIDYTGKSGGEVLFSLSEVSTTSKVAVTEHERSNAVMVPSTTLSDLLREAAIRCYALVCDIEGAEAALAQDDSNALKACQQIIIELHDTELSSVKVSAADTARALERLGFSALESYGAVSVYVRS